jgi:preprotein translocase subunit SecA
MMDRIEDETIRFLFFMRIDPGVGVPVPYPEPLDELEEEAEEPEPELVAANVQARQKEAQQSVLDLTRNIQRKKDRELAELQFSGGDGTSQSKTVSKTQKVGRNELCPCGSGKKYKKCHGAQA